MKIYIYSMYDKTGELLAKGTAKELARRRGRPELSYGHWAAAGKPTVPAGPGVPVW